jgi:hypothetical protein
MKNKMNKKIGACLLNGPILRTVNNETVNEIIEAASVMMRKD